jgi:hypothetical protein
MQVHGELGPGGGFPGEYARQLHSRFRFFAMLLLAVKRGFLTREQAAHRWVKALGPVGVVCEAAAGRAHRDGKGAQG